MSFTFTQTVQIIQSTGLISLAGTGAVGLYKFWPIFADKTKLIGERNDARYRADVAEKALELVQTINADLRESLESFRNDVLSLRVDVVRFEHKFAIAVKWMLDAMRAMKLAGRQNDIPPIPAELADDIARGMQDH